MSQSDTSSDKPRSRMRPGLIFDHKRHPQVEIGQWKGRVSRQRWLREVLERGQELPHGLVFIMDDGTIIMGLHDPCLTNGPSFCTKRLGWSYRIHLNASDSDAEFCRFYRIQVAPGGLITAKHIEINRTPIEP